MYCNGKLAYVLICNANETDSSLRYNQFISRRDGALQSDGNVKWNWLPDRMLARREHASMRPVLKLEGTAGHPRRRREAAALSLIVEAEIIAQRDLSSEGLNMSQVPQGEEDRVHKHLHPGQLNARRVPARAHHTHRRPPSQPSLLDRCLTKTNFNRMGH